MENESVNAVAGSLVDAPGIFREPEATPAPTNELGKDAFLKLLVAQLRYQDPLEPSSSDEFIATTAQFTVVEKLDELTKQGENTALVNSLTTASSLVGREVTATRSGVPVTAVVEESRIVAGAVQLQTTVGAIGLDEIISVGAAPAPAPTPEVTAPTTEEPSTTIDDTTTVDDTATADDTATTDDTATADATAAAGEATLTDDAAAADDPTETDTSTETGNGSEAAPESETDTGVEGELASTVAPTATAAAEPTVAEPPTVDQPVVPNVRVVDEDLTDVEPSDQSTQVAETADVQPDVGDERNDPIDVDGEDDAAASTEAPPAESPAVILPTEDDEADEPQPTQPERTVEPIIDEPVVVNEPVVAEQSVVAEQPVVVEPLAPEPLTSEADDQQLTVPAPEVIPQSPVQSADEVETTTNTPFDPFTQTV